MWIYDYNSEKDNPFKQAPFVTVLHMSYVDNLPTWTYPFHVHDNAYEMTFVHRGKGRFVLDHQTSPLEAGSIVIIPPNLLHYFSSDADEPMRYYTLRFLETGEDAEPLNYIRSLGAAIIPGGACLSYIENSMQLLFNLHQVNGGIVDETFQSIVLSLIQLSRSLSSIKTLSVRANDHCSASDILNYISEHSTEKHTLESLSKHFNISPSHLSRIFSSAYHMSPINYSIHARITYATEYLLKTNYSVSEIAYLVGYDNPTHFTNMFIKRLGCTPSEYREQNMKLPPKDSEESEKKKG